MTTLQLQRAVSALGMAWQHETGTPFEAMGFLGTVTLQAFATGFPSPESFQEALIRCAYDLGDTATRSHVADSSLQECNRTAKLFAEVCKAAISL